MTDTDKLALSILRALDIAVLIRDGTRRYVLLDRPSDTIFSIFPDLCETGVDGFWDERHPLGRFLIDAENFFSNNTTGSLTSGMLRFGDETIGSPALVAGAICLPDRQILTLRLVPKEMAAIVRAPSRGGREAGSAPPASPDAQGRFDSLTSLLNRDAFLDCLGEMIEDVREYGDISLLFMDIDDFKGLNDVFGEEKGDMVLASLGKLLGSFLRREDLVARYAGGRFAVLAPYTMQHQVLRMAEKLRTEIADNDFGSLPPVTVSIGCATFRNGESREEFIGRAELALADAKSAGKNLVRLR